MLFFGRHLNCFYFINFFPIFVLSRSVTLLLHLAFLCHLFFIDPFFFRASICALSVGLFMLTRFSNFSRSMAFVYVTSTIWKIVATIYLIGIVDTFHRFSLITYYLPFLFFCCLYFDLFRQLKTCVKVKSPTQTTDTMEKVRAKKYVTSDIHEIQYFWQHLHSKW